MRPEHCFERIATGIDTAELVARIEAQPQLWHGITARQDYPGSAHHDTQSIILRGPLPTSRDVFNDVECMDYRPYVEALSPEIETMIGRCLYSIGQTYDLGRVMITNLRRDGFIDAHVDEGKYADKFDRFHLALHARPGNRFNVGQHFMQPVTGELYWFNHKITHSLVNLSDDARWHLIIDVAAPAWRMARNRALAANSIEVRQWR